MAHAVIGSVLSVNVGRPRTATWFGREVTTAIWKEPVEGRVVARAVNLEGDGQADLRVHGGHDKAVYAYAAEDEAWWADRLGRPVEPGTFGENLTTQGLDPRAAVIGERWAVGTVVLEVSEPRLPCSKLSMRMGDPAFKEQFAEAGRLGTYLRIVEEGDLGAGDQIALVARPGHHLTVGEVGRVHADLDPEGLRLMLTVDELSDDWRTWAQRQLARR